jgi:putative PEP-CTERM system histidine kinase
LAHDLLVRIENFLSRLEMDSVFNLNALLLVNLALVSGLFLYLLVKIRRHPGIAYLAASLVPLIAFQLGSYLFSNWPNSADGARLLVLAVILTPLTVVPLSHTLGRTHPDHAQKTWIVYYALQILLLVFVTREIFEGRVIEWVTGILDQPIIIVEQTWRYYFLNVVASSIIALMCFDRTLQAATKPQQEAIKFVFIAFLGFTVYFSYLSANIVVSSYLSQSVVRSGAAVILCGLVLLAYGFAKYPFWQVTIRVSRHLVFGCLSATAALMYLIVSGSILNVLRWLQPEGFNALLPATAFALIALFLVFYLSPRFHSTFRSFVTRHFFRNKYDYRDLWMKFSEKSSGSLNIRDVLPRIAEFITDAMFVRQVVFWLRSTTSEAYNLAYCHEHLPNVGRDPFSLRLDRSRWPEKNAIFFTVPTDEALIAQFPVDKAQRLKELGVERLVLVEQGNEVLALIGIGAQHGGEKSSAEDDQFMSSVSNQLGHLILTHKLSEELLLAREWDSFNRFASFILHDLKNLATLQGMTLENAKHLSHNQNFVTDAFATFTQTTNKMINLIASLSVQKGQFSLKQQPVNILEILTNTFDDLKIKQRNGVKVLTAFPPKDKLPIISGDPELLQKAFTNLLLNAIQSLPKGEGAVEITVAPESAGKITTSIRDTGCGIPAEQLEGLFRPFQTTKEKGMGIGLCHTRSIIEVHGGQIRIESQVNAGTKVEVELPTL